MCCEGELNICNQIPTYKRDMRSVITASFEDVLWKFSGPAALRFYLRGLDIELIIVPSDKPVVVQASASTVLTDDMIRSMTESGKRSSKYVPPVETTTLEDVDYSAASPTVQNQVLYRQLKEQVCDSLSLARFHTYCR